MAVVVAGGGRPALPGAALHTAGGLLLDVGRAKALYGMVCTAFAVLLAFVVFVGFQSFNQGRSGAKLEAFSVVELFRTAGCFGRVDPFRPDPGAG